MVSHYTKNEKAAAIVLPVVVVVFFLAGVVAGLHEDFMMSALYLFMGVFLTYVTMSFFLGLALKGIFRFLEDRFPRNHDMPERSVGWRLARCLPILSLVSVPVLACLAVIAAVHQNALALGVCLCGCAVVVITCTNIAFIIAVSVRTKQLKESLSLSDTVEGGKGLGCDS